MGPFICEHCGSLFSRKDNLQRHIVKYHSETLHFPCFACRSSFSTREELELHRGGAHPPTSDETTTGDFERIQHAHRRACELYRHVFQPLDEDEVQKRITDIFPKARRFLKQILAERKFIKVAFVLMVEYRKEEEIEGVDAFVETPFRTFTQQLTLGTNLKETLSRMFALLVTSFEDFNANGSGWILHRCLHFDVEVYECKPLQGSCMLHNIHHRQHGAFQVSSSDNSGECSVAAEKNQCFYFAVAKFLAMKAKTKCDLKSLGKIVSSFKDVNDGPMLVKKIGKFEAANKDLDLAINVLFRDECEDIIPCLASRNLKAKNVINLLLVFLDNTDEMHYCLVDDIRKLLRSTKKSAGDNTYTVHQHICFNCFTTFSRAQHLKKHLEWCSHDHPQAYDIPAKGKVVKFETGGRSAKVKYVFFFDFETLQTTPSDDARCRFDSKKCTVVSEQEAFAYTFVMVDREGRVVEHITYDGVDADEHFLSTLLRIEKKYASSLTTNVPLVMTSEDRDSFSEATHCYICNKEFDESIQTKSRVRDHDHDTGKYLGAAHNGCNLIRREKERIVGFAHNFSGYDSHIVMNAIAKYEANRGDDKRKLSLKAIPLNGQKFKCLEIGKCLLLDSMSFLNAPLDKLVDTMRTSNCQFPITRQWQGQKEKWEKLLRKGVYPYEYVTSLDKLEDTCLPPKAAFFSNLSNSDITDEDYQHAQNVWRTFQCKNLRDYSRLYVQTDTFLLADIVFEFRNAIFDEFQLDMCHYLSLPMLTKDIMLSVTGVEMELMSDFDMIQFIRKNLRGGLSYVNTRYANSKKLSEDKGRDTSIVYVDANNLYGSAMRFPMPEKDFQWMTKEEIQNYDPLAVKETDTKGYILEVDLEYPESLHLSHSSFPLAPHHMDITGDMLSPYANSVLQSLLRQGAYKSSKLTSTFLKRKKYVCHALNLKLYLQQGLKLKKIHRAISFTQRPFIRPFIDIMSKKRAEAATKFLSDLMKLIINSFFGKMIENSGNRMDCHFVTSHEKAIRRNTDPRMKGHLILNEDFSICFFRKSRVNLAQSWAVGFSILDLSKFIMQDLMYNTLKKQFGDNLGVILTDTDSWVLMLPGAHQDQILPSLSSVMDFSNYSTSHPLFDSSKKNKPGLLKNEIPNDEIRSVVALQSKTYALKRLSGTLDSRCKGVKKSVKRSLKFKNFLSCINSISECTVSQYCIRSVDHKNRLLQLKKRAFSSFDDKRFLLCAIHSVPYGSKFIKASRKLDACFFCRHPMLYS